MENNKSNNSQKGEKPYKRRTIIIKKDLQFRYVTIIFVSVLIGFLIFGLEIIWNVSRIFSERPALLAPLLAEVKLMIPVFVVKLVIYLVVVLIVASVISHRIAGPLYKFEKSAKTIADGDLTHRVYLRKDDHLTEFQKQFNNMVSNLQNKVNKNRKTAVEVSDEIKKTADGLTDENLKNKLKLYAEKLLEVSKEFKS